MECSKQDWKLFREKFPNWQEMFMERLNQEYVELLTGEGNPSEKFWALYKRIREDKQSRGVLLRLSKQNMVYDIAAFINEGVITFSDLDDFSDELRDTVQFFCSRNA